MDFWSFGHDVALDGDTAIVGADGADIGGNQDQGAAYVFVRQQKGWVEQAQLLASDGAALNWFGRSVAIAGDTAIVGAPLADIGVQTFQGAVYVFLRSGSQWTEVQKLTASDGDAQDRLGWSVAVQGDTIVAGALAADIDGEDSQGAAYVFVDQGGLWDEEAKLFDPQGQLADLFGHDVTLQGDTALIGAESANVDGDPNRGAAYVFTRTGSAWDLEQKLLASDGAEPDLFGSSVALDREGALIGAQQKMIEGNPSQGAAYIFRRNGTTWIEEQRLTASDGHAEANFGLAAALLGPVALVSAEFNFPGDPERGVAYEFREQGGVWVEIQKFAAPIGEETDSFGRAISLTADRLLVGNPGNTVVSPPGGTAWIFQRPILFEDGFESGDTAAWDQSLE